MPELCKRAALSFLSPWVELLGCPETFTMAEDPKLHLLGRNLESHSRTSPFEEIPRNKNIAKTPLRKTERTSNTAESRCLVLATKNRSLSLQGNVLALGLGLLERTEALSQCAFCSGMPWYDSKEH